MHERTTSAPDLTSSLDDSSRSERPFAVLIAALIIVLAGVVAYSNSLHGPFFFDDVSSIYKNPTIRALWPIWRPLLPPTGYAVDARPVVNLSLAINYAIGRHNVVGYHIFNIAVHLLAALTLFGLVRRTLALPGVAEHLRQRATPLALIIALLWTLHPLQTEAVTFIIQRAETMMALFYLLTLYCALRGALASRGAWWWYAAAVGACLLGMGSKEVMVSAALMVLLYDRIFLSGSLRQAWRRRWGLYLGLALTWILLAALVLDSRGRGGAAGFNAGMTAWEYARTQFAVVVHYLRLAVWPHPLVVDYGRWVADQPMEIIPFALIILLLFAATVAALFAWPRIGFVALCFFVILAPSSSVVPLVTQVAAEKRMYLPLASVLILAVLGLDHLWRRWRTQAQLSGPAARIIPMLVLAAVAVLYTWRTLERNRDYRSALVMWHDTAEKMPDNTRALVNYGTELFLLDRFEEAIDWSSKALALDPTDAGAYYNRAAAAYRLGRYEEAVADYTRAIEFKHPVKDAQRFRGKALRRLGRHEQALADFAYELKRRPENHEIHAERALALAALGRTSEALPSFDRAIELAPERAQLYFERGRVHGKAGQLEQAIADFDEAIRLAPGNAAAHYHRGLAWAELDEHHKAIADFTRALELDAKLGPAYLARSMSYRAVGALPAARRDAETVLRMGGRLDPEHREALGLVPPTTTPAPAPAP